MERVELLHDFDDFCRLNFMEDRKAHFRYSKYYAHKRGSTDYNGMIQQALYTATRTKNSNIYLEVGNFMGYMLEIDPNLSVNSNKLLDDFINIGLRNLKSGTQVIMKEEANSTYSMLGKLITNNQSRIMMGEGHSALGTEKVQVILVHLNIFESKVNWQLQKCDEFMRIENMEIVNLLNSFVYHLKNISYQQNSQVIKGKISFLNSVLNFLLIQKQRIKHSEPTFVRFESMSKQIIINEIKNYQLRVIKNDPCERLFNRLIQKSIELYGIYNENWLENFVNKHLNNLIASDSVELTNTLVIHFKRQNLQLRKEFISKMVQGIYNNIFFPRGEDGNNKIYQTIKSHCNLIITLSGLYHIDFTKRILHQISKRKNSNLVSNFLSSLLVLNLYKLDASTLQRANLMHYSNYFKENFYVAYQKLLEDYAVPIYDMEQLCLDPETRDAKVPFQLLTIRNTVIVGNMTSIYAQAQVVGFLANTLRFILHNVRSEECNDVAILILARTSEFSGVSLIALERIEISQLVEQSSHDHILPNNLSIKFFTSVIKKLKEITPVQDIENLNLFRSLSSMVMNIIKQERRMDQEFFVEASTVLKLSLPKDINNLDSFEIELAFQILLNLISLDVSHKFYQVYLELLYLTTISTKRYGLVQSGAISEMMNNLRVDQVSWSQRQINDMISYMFNFGMFNDQAVQTCWQHLRKPLDKIDPDFCLFVMKLFLYMQIQFKQGRIEQGYNKPYWMFLAEQIHNCKDLMGSIASAINNTQLKQTAIKLFQVLAKVQDYLICAMKDYEEIKPEASTDFNGFQQFGLNIMEFILKKHWIPDFEESQHFSRFKTIWGTCSELQIVIVSFCSRLSNNPSRRANHYQKILFGRSSEIASLFSQDKHKNPKQIMSTWHRVVLSQMSSTVPLQFVQ